MSAIVGMLVENDISDRGKVIAEIEEEIRLGEHWDEQHRTVDLQLLKDVLELLKKQENYIPVSWLEQYTRLKCTESWHNMANAIIKTWQETNKKSK